MRARVTRVEDYGLYASFEGGDVLVLVPEASWTAIRLPDTYREGDEIRVSLTRYVEEQALYTGSMKILTENPYAGLCGTEGEVLEGRVVRIDAHRVWLELPNGAWGALPADVFEATPAMGARLQVHVGEVDPERRRVALTLAQTSQNSRRRRGQTPMALVSAPFCSSYFSTTMHWLRHLFKRRMPSAEGKALVDELQRDIRWIAESSNTSKTFRERAKKTAEKRGSRDLELLAGLFHSESEPPDHLRAQFPRLGQWMAACQFAVFEVLYNIGPPSLPLLRRTAFGEYDWTQGNAIEVLCRLAADGVQPDQILAEIEQHAPSIRDEALYYAAGPLKLAAAQNPSLQALVPRLLQISEFKNAWDSVA